MEGKSVISLKVTEEQKELIYAMWAHNEWNVELANDETGNGNLCAQCNRNLPAQLGPEDNIDGHDFHIASQEGEAECPHCLFRPCVTSQCFRQLWWETENHEPCDDNGQFRKEHYKRFWVMLLNRGAWQDPRYQAKKALALQEDANRQHNVWIGPSRSHPRDIMPRCIVSLVRQWLPNATKPYMGHRWA